MAQYMYKKYSSKQDVFGPKIGAKAGRHRMALPPFNRMYADALGLFMAGAASPVGKARAWRNAPVEIKQPVYDRMHERLATLAKRAGLDPAKAFPEPPGMAEYRKNKAAADPADSELKSKPLNEK